MAKKNEPRVYRADLAADFGEDRRNANAGTERGHAMLEKSIAEFGAGRSMLADQDGHLIAGNKTREALIAAGMTEVIVVETDGTTPVVVKRTDLTLKKRRARRLADAGNRVAEVDLRWDPAVLSSDQEMGLLDGFFSEKEVAQLMKDDEDLGGGDDESEGGGDESGDDIECPHCGQMIRIKKD